MGDWESYHGEHDLGAAREYASMWLHQAPEFAEGLGFKLDGIDALGKRLEVLGEGRDAIAVFFEQDGAKRVLKITGSVAQGAMSLVALDDSPEFVVPIYDVVEADIPPRTKRLPSLAGPDQDPVTNNEITFGIIEKFVVPVDNFMERGAVGMGGLSADDFARMWFEMLEGGSYVFNERMQSIAARWHRSFKGAQAWIEEACGVIGSSADWDLHSGNFGVDPDTMDLLLIDLGQCYEIEP